MAFKKHRLQVDDRVVGWVWGGWLTMGRWVGKGRPGMTLLDLDTTLLDFGMALPS